LAKLTFKEKQFITKLNDILILHAIYSYYSFLLFILTKKEREKEREVCAKRVKYFLYIEKQDPFLREKKT
jgi:hypothetical protein